MNIKAIVMAIASLFIVALLGAVMLLEEKLESERFKSDRLKADYAETLASVSAMQADHARTVQALETLNAAQIARAETLAHAIREIDNAPDTEDGNVAPVLRRALDGLRD